MSNKAAGVGVCRRYARLNLGPSGHARASDITGYAIVSDDDKIAGADGLTPTSLRNEKDWELYQRAQEVANLVVFARRSHELEPNVHRNVRLVVSREAARPRAAPGRLVVGPAAHDLGRSRGQNSAERAGSSPWAADRWCSISSSRSALTAFTCRARMGSNFPADDRSFPPAMPA